ncbi:hypothetical protein, variant [Sphaeroforma arctica JP610]|uniref:Origin recognition complex subunit 1 n=1 Tax=Sphaeroforma arctica JP610 TaxID=667725 RepID=A0A0L0GGF4_9EUKA|nr:hypothetical protein, variant [Sphaeroforma arctica JP610]KNC87403.1 hypothetical protein, variant [Sphaeroforma arctica JP610]|eukprot:XP_014161305.1 hypothetical protein, variant [Sphaeroforma arctica JP610]
MGKDFPYMDENGSISKTNILREKRIRTPTQIYASTKLVTAFEGTKDKKAQKKLDTFKKRQKANAKRGKKSKACFKWLGKPVSTRYDEEHDDRITRYKTFEFDDTIYRKGTSVHLRNARKPTMPHVGLILDCFEAETDGLQYVRVQWFLRDNELPKSLRAMVKKKQTVETALIIDATRNVADMLAEELVEAVMVCPAWEHKPPQPRIAEVADSIESDGSSPVCKTPARNVRAERSVEEDEDDVPKYYVQFTYDADNKSVAELTRDTYASWKLEVFKHAEVKESGAEDDAADDEDYKVTADESDDSGSEGEVESDGQSLAQEDDEDSDEDKPICSKRKRVTTRRKRTRKRKAPRPRAKPKTPGVSKTKKQKIMEGLAKTINDRANRRDNTSTIAGAEEDVYEKARRMLHVSAVPDNLPCRENEFAEIYGFAEGHITGRESGSMYISGVPGTGKTATVHEVMRQLKSSADEGDLPEFKFVEINGMQLTDIMQAYTQIWKGLTDDKVTPKQALDNLKRYFTTPSPRKECIVLLVDELDQLISTQHSVMYEIFR